MKFTEENSIQLYHYFTELLDPLRGIRNNPEVLNNPDNINSIYWDEKLCQLRNIIDDILDYPIQNVSSDSLQADLFNSFLPLLKSYQDEQFRNDIFKIVLKESLHTYTEEITSLNLLLEISSAAIKSSIVVTDEAIKQIKQHYQVQSEP